MRKDYNQLLKKVSDIYMHLPTLKYYTEKCDHVTEFGVRDCVSTYAFIEGKPKILRCYDIIRHQNMKDAQDIAIERGIDCKFIIGSTLIEEIEPTDFLFIDTLHNYAQLKQELKLHESKVKKYIGFHDVITFGNKNERPQPGKQGLIPAIFEFLLENDYWKSEYFSYENNGLLILKNVREI